MKKIEHLDMLEKALILNQLADQLGQPLIDLNGEQFKDELSALVKEHNKLIREIKKCKQSDLWTLDPEDTKHTLVRLTNLGEFQMQTARGWKKAPTYVRGGYDAVRYRYIKY